MKTLYSCLALVLFCAGCSKPSSGAAQTFILTATIKDIMDSMVEPSADEIWDSVATISNTAGIEERQPRTDEEWAAVRRRAITLLEATNLITIEGRHVAKPGEKARVEAIELAPEEIERRIYQDRDRFVALAHALHAATLPALQAIEARSPDKLLEAGQAIDEACENCHLKYWYPMDKSPARK